MLNLLKDSKIVRVMNAVVAGTTEQKSSVVDMLGFENVMFIAAFGTITDGSVITCTPYENTINATTGSPTSSGVAPTVTGSTSSNGMVIADVVQPQKRYVYLDITRTTQNAVIDGVIAILYNGDKKPVTADATVLASAIGQG